MKSFRNNKTNRRVSKKQKRTRKHTGGTKAAAEDLFAEFSKAPSKVDLNVVRDKIKLLTTKSVSMPGKKDGSSLLHQAISLGNKEIVELLIIKGAELNTQYKFGWTALHSAVEFQNVEIVKLLLDKGARTDIKSKSNETALELAEEKETPNLEIVNLLKEQ